MRNKQTISDLWETSRILSKQQHLWRSLSTNKKKITSLLSSPLARRFPTLEFPKNPSIIPFLYRPSPHPLLPLSLLPAMFPAHPTTCILIRPSSHLKCNKHCVGILISLRTNLLCCLKGSNLPIKVRLKNTHFSSSMLNCQIYSCKTLIWLSFMNRI